MQDYEIGWRAAAEGKQRSWAIEQGAEVLRGYDDFLFYLTAAG